MKQIEEKNIEKRVYETPKMKVVELQSFGCTAQMLPTSPTPGIPD